MLAHGQDDIASRHPAADHHVGRKIPFAGRQYAKCAQKRLGTHAIGKEAGPAGGDQPGRGDAPACECISAIGAE